MLAKESLVVYKIAVYGDNLDLHRKVLSKLCEHLQSPTVDHNAIVYRAWIDHEPVECSNPDVVETPSQGVVDE